MLRFALFLPLLASLSWAADDKKPDFTGNWELNVAKSRFGNMPKPTRMTLKSEQKGEVLHASQTTYDQQGSRTVEGDWFLDGKEHPVVEFGGGKSVTKWSGSTLFNEKKSNDGQYLQTGRLSLSRDGKIATEKIHTKNPNGTNDSTLVWDKK